MKKVVKRNLNGGPDMKDNRNKAIFGFNSDYYTFFPNDY